MEVAFLWVVVLLKKYQYRKPRVVLCLDLVVGGWGHKFLFNGFTLSRGSMVVGREEGHSMGAA